MPGSKAGRILAVLVDVCFAGIIYYVPPQVLSVLVSPTLGYRCTPGFIKD